MKKIVIFFALSCVFLLLIFLYHYLKFEDGKLHLVVCDVGQGDAIFIRTAQGADILIDGGPDDSVILCLGRHMPFWDRSIEAVILTHPHADHLTGLLPVLKRYQVMSFYTQKVEGNTKVYHLLQDQLAEKKLSASFLQKGDGFSDGKGFGLKAFWPSLELIEAAHQNRSNFDLNQSSVVSLITFGNFKALLTGDAEEPIVSQIASEIGDISMLKVPHQGATKGMSENFLGIVKPELAVISVGKRNKYGHPKKSSLDLLSKFGVKILRTDLNGDVEVISDGKTWEYKASR